MSPKNKTDLMIDIETLGTTPGSAILSIAAVPFNIFSPLEHFYQKVSQKSCIEVGLTVDDATVDWWNKQPIEVQQEAFSGRVHISVVLAKLSSYIETLGPVRVWGDGASFDVPLLEAAYAKCGLKPKWKYYDSMCYRTLKNLFPHMAVGAAKMKHNALEDARYQASVCEQILKLLRV